MINLEHENYIHIKGIKKYTCFFAFVLLVLFVSACTSSQSPEKPTEHNLNSRKQEKSWQIKPGQEGPDAETKAEMEKIRQTIDAAIEQAKKEGKTSIDIHLDENFEKVQNNDLVTVAVTASLDDGTVISGHDATQPAVRRIIAGKRNVMPGLGRSVVGMVRGEQKNVILNSEDAFGSAEKHRPVTLPAKRVIPRVIEVGRKEYLRTRKKEPVLGENIQVFPFFKSEVVSIDPDKVIMVNHARDGYVETSPEGKTSIAIKGDDIIVALSAKVGSVFYLGEKKGIITASSENNFTIGFNHPFAGKKLNMDIKVLDFKKASEFAGMELPWIEGHDNGMDAALEQKKNKVLILYADWCRWCKKLFRETLTDPRVKELKDEFVWVKADSDKDPGLKAFYKQEGYPMIVLTDDKGKILKKSEGYKDAEHFLLDLEKVMGLKLAKNDNR